MTSTLLAVKKPRLDEGALRALPIYGRDGRIVRVIEELGVSQERFGKMIGRSRESVNAWVNARQTTDQRSARRIAELARQRLGLDVAWTDFYEQEPPTPLTQLSDDLGQVRDQIAQLASEQAELHRLLRGLAGAVERLAELDLDAERDESADDPPRRASVPPHTE